MQCLSSWGCQHEPRLTGRFSYSGDCMEAGREQGQVDVSLLQADGMNGLAYLALSRRVGACS